MHNDTFQKGNVCGNNCCCGAGNGGSAIAAYLSSLHVKVNLCDLFPEYIEGIQAAGGIDLIQDGACKHCTLNLVTSDVAQAIRGVRLILVVTPSFTHRLIAEACCTALTDGQVVVLNPGRTGGALDADLLLPKNRACCGRNLRSQT